MSSLHTERNIEAKQGAKRCDILQVVCHSEINKIDGLQVNSVKKISLKFSKFNSFTYIAHI